MVINLGHFPLGDIWLRLKIFWLLQLNQGEWCHCHPSEQRPGTLLNTLQHTEPSRSKNYPAPNVSCAKVEKVVYIGEPFKLLVCEEKV